MTTTIVIIFLTVYLGMILGGLPFLQLDRTGVALLGAIAMISFDAVTLEEAAEAVHLPTIILLFSFLVLSAQMRMGGFYGWVTRGLATMPLSPAKLLAAMMLVVALLSAIFSNDIVCLAIAPVLINACEKRRLDPVPYLLALACAANIGSAWTLIGNPQNILIGQTLRLSFHGYFLEAAVPVALGLAATWGLIAWQVHGRWHQTAENAAIIREETRNDAPFNPGRLQKALSWPPSCWWHSYSGLAALGVDMHQPGPLFVGTFLLSNIVSNVPAVMLLLPLAQQPWAGPLLALVSRFAGNLLIVGSIGNIIVVDSAARRGISIDWHRHARVGVPVTLATLAITAVWLSLRVAHAAPP